MIGAAQMLLSLAGDNAAVDVPDASEPQAACGLDDAGRSAGDNAAGGVDGGGGVNV